MWCLKTNQRRHFNYLLVEINTVQERFEKGSCFTHFLCSTNILEHTLDLRMQIPEDLYVKRQGIYQAIVIVNIFITIFVWQVQF
jgi:hypothetical protein